MFYLSRIWIANCRKRKVRKLHNMSFCHLGILSDPRQRQRIFLLASASRPALRPTQPPIQWVPGVLSPGVKRVTLTTHPHLVPRIRMSRSYTSSTRSASMVCSGTAYFTYWGGGGVFFLQLAIHLASHFIDPSHQTWIGISPIDICLESKQFHYFNQCTLIILL
jgi:hypothetical protein